MMEEWDDEMMEEWDDRRMKVEEWKGGMIEG